MNKFKRFLKDYIREMSIGKLFIKKMPIKWKMILGSIFLFLLLIGEFFAVNGRNIYLLGFLMFFTAFFWAIVRSRQTIIRTHYNGSEKGVLKHKQTMLGPVFKLSIK